METVLVAAATAAYVTYLLARSPGVLHGTDPYYHAKFAWLTWTQGVLDAFPWAQFSIWNDRFFDKEFLWHLAVAPFTALGLVAGAKVAAGLFAVGTAVAFHRVLVGQRVAHAWAWTALLLAAGSTFGYRLTMLRPHTLGVTLALLVAWAVLRRRHGWVAVLCAVYALAYTAHYLALVFAAVLAGLHLAKAGRVDWRTLAAPVAGVLVGWVLHPNFPHNVGGFFVQNVLVLQAAWDPAVDLNLGAELGSATARQYLLTFAPLWAVLGAALVSLLLVPRRPSLPVLYWGALAVGALALMMMGKRFVEYGVPFTLVFCALVLPPRVEALAARWSRRRATWAVAVIGLLLGVLLYRSVGETVAAVAVPDPPPYRAHARWLAANTPAETTVFTCNWSTPPHLFFHNHHNRYMVFLDPTFMYLWDADKWRLWTAMTRGNIVQAPSHLLVEGYGLRHGFCEARFERFRQRLAEDPAMEIVLENAAGYTFRVRPGAGG